MSVESPTHRDRRRELASASVPRLAFRVVEAAAVLGVSVDFFRSQVAPEVRWVRRGSVKLVPRAELERWLEENSARTLDDEDGER